MFSERDIGRLEGLVVGEGHIRGLLLRNLKSKAVLQNNPRIVIQMTDKDAVEWFAASYGGKTFSVKINGTNRRPAWRAAAYGDNAVRLCKLIYPTFCARKNKEIEELFASAATRMSNSESGRKGAAVSTLRYKDKCTLPLF